MPPPAGAAPLGGPRPAFLLCPPRYYAVRYRINPWMDPGRPPDRARARAQWRALTDLLAGLGARLRYQPPVPGLPDLVFTANAGLVAGRLFIAGTFRHAERRGEERVDARWFRAHGWHVTRLPVRFEGEGDALRQGPTWFLGSGFRTDPAARAPLARLLRRRVLGLALVDERFYHLDTCFAPLDGRTALWYPPAFDSPSRRALARAVPDPVAVGEADARRFACNAIPVGRTVVVHRGISPGLRRALARRGFAVREADLSQFLKAGGAAKCLVLRLAGPVV